MSVFHLFEDARRANAAWYTQNPLEAMTDEELAATITRLGLDKTVAELRAEATTPHLEMTCALCGRPQAHLVSCPGCGRDAWGWEWEMVKGGMPMDAVNPSDHAANRLRTLTRSALLTLGFSEAQVEHGLKHAWQWGGCMICAECWQHTLPVEAYQICPLNLISEGRYNPRAVPAFLWPLFAQIRAQKDHPAAQERLILEELSRIAAHWLENWNTAPEPERAQVALWRTGLLMAYMPEMGQTPEKPPQTEPK